MPGLSASFASVELILYNFSDPKTDVDGERSHKDTPHPFWTDPVVLQAFACFIGRPTIGIRSKKPRERLVRCADTHFVYALFVVR
jgi:hypothetical protein